MDCDDPDCMYASQCHNWAGTTGEDRGSSLLPPEKGKHCYDGEQHGRAQVKTRSLAQKAPRDRFAQGMTMTGTVCMTATIPIARSISAALASAQCKAIRTYMTQIKSA